MGGRGNIEERGRKKGDSAGVEGEGSREWRWREEESGTRRGREYMEEGDGMEIDQEQKENEFKENVELETQIQAPLSLEIVISEKQYSQGEEREQDDDIRILEGRIAGDIGRGGGEGEGMSQERMRGDLHTGSQERQGRHSTYALAIQAGKRRGFPQLVEDDEEEETARGPALGFKKKGRKRNIN